MAKKKSAVPELRPAMNEQPGAPTKLSPERLKIICDEIAGGATFRDACAMADINESTLARWRGRGAAEPDGEFGEFCKALEHARMQRRRWYRAEVLRLTTEKKDWRGVLAIAALTEPEEFTPKVQMILQQELTAAIDRLKTEFANEPDTLERCFQAIAYGSSELRPSDATDTKRAFL